MSRQQKVTVVGSVGPENERLQAEDILVRSLPNPLTIHRDARAVQLPAVIGSARDAPLIRVWCGPCRTVVGRVLVLGGVWRHCDGLPQDMPHIGLSVRLTLLGGSRNEMAWARILVNRRDDPEVGERMRGLGVSVDLPPVVPTDCPVHGTIPVPVQELRARAWKAWQGLRNHDPDTPGKARSWNLMPSPIDSSH